MKKFLMITAVAVFQFSMAQITKDVGQFSSLKVYDKIKVTLHQSSENSVETNNADVEFVNKNGELKIRMTAAQILQGDGTTVKVNYEQLCDIQASQGSSVSGNDEFDCKTLSLTSNEGSQINLSLNIENLNAKLNSGGIIELSGVSENQDIVVNSGGKFLAKNVESERVKVAVNAGRVAEINASDSVEATTRAGGVIDVYGDPNDRKVKNLIGGKVNFK